MATIIVTPAANMQNHRDRQGVPFPPRALWLRCTGPGRVFRPTGGRRLATVNGVTVHPGSTIGHAWRLEENPCWERPATAAYKKTTVGSRQPAKAERMGFLAALLESPRHA